MNSEKYSLPLRMQPLGMLDESAIKRIIEAGIRVLKQVGFNIDGNGEFFDYLQNYGCAIEGKHVAFPDAVIDKALARICETKNKNLQNKAGAEPSGVVRIMPSGQGYLWSRPEDDKPLPATREHLAGYHRMIDSLDLIPPHPGLIPQDVPVKTADLHAFATIALNCREPRRVSPYSAEIIPYFLEVMTVTAGSKEQAIKKAPFFHKLWISSPFTISRESIDGVLTSRRLLGHKIMITIMPCSGTSAPVTASGAIVQEVAEVLGANIISLAVDDCLAGYCSSTFAFDMKSNFITERGPDSSIRRILGCETASYWFGNPLVFGGIGPGTTAPVPGVQSMMEKCIDATIAVLGGIRTFGGGGCLSQGDSASAVQLLLDLELRDYLQRLVTPVDISDEALAEEVIKKIAPQGARYLESEHTFEYFRKELWLPNFLDRRGIKVWMEKPYEMLEAARKKAIDMLENSPNKCPLDRSQRDEIERICRSADRDLG